MFVALLNILILLSGINQSIIDDYLKANLIGYDKFEYGILNKKIISENEFKIDYSREFTIKNHYGYIPIIIKKDKYEQRTFLRVNLKLYQKVLVAKRKIKRREKPNYYDFEIKLCDVSELRDKAVTEFSELNNSRIRINIKEGEILTYAMIEKNDDVIAGEKVTAFYDNGTVKISFPVTLRSGGKKGEAVRVQRKDGIVFKAKVISKNEVLILE